MLKHIIAPDYWPGLKVVPIVMAAEIMMGIYFNLSFWYKLTDRTIWGAVFSGVGCVVLIVVNILFIPQYSYMACAWAGVAGYGTAMLLSYFVGQKYYPIAYPLKSIAVYVLVAAFFFLVMTYTPQTWPLWARLGINTLCIVLFLAHIVYHDLPLSSLPVVGKYFRKNKPSCQRHTAKQPCRAVCASFTNAPSPVWSIAATSSKPERATKTLPIQEWPISSNI